MNLYKVYLDVRYDGEIVDQEMLRVVAETLVQAHNKAVEVCEEQVNALELVWDEIFVSRIRLVDDMVLLADFDDPS